MSKESNKLVIGTHNLFKIQEINFFLDGLPVSLINLSDLPPLPEIVEDGQSLLDNANKKARIISGHTHDLVIASDAGVAVPALPNWDYRTPKRNLGEKSTPIERIHKMMQIISELDGPNRRVVYTMALSLASRGEVLWAKEFLGYEGQIVTQPDLTEVGIDHWMGRMWYVEEFGKTEDKLSEQERIQLRNPQVEVKQELQQFIHKYFLTAPIYNPTRSV
jgi:XTP/dITP diphosphohydrolase